MTGITPETTAIDLLCIGNALVDIFAQDEENIDTYFNLNENIQHIPMGLMSEILAVLPEFTVCSGGGSANVAKIASLLGMKAVFMGALGADHSKARSDHENPADRFGELFEKELNGAGVQTVLPRKQPPTGICLMLQMPDGEVKIACSPSAALELCENDIDEEIICETKVLVIDGFMLGRRNLVRHILELADKYGTVVAIDISSTALAADMAVEILTYARAYPLIIFMNEDEAKAFYSVLNRKQAPSSDEPGLSPALVNLFRDYTANDIFPVLAVKLGIRGAIVFAGGNVYREETVPVIPLETTGAGDAFCAAFLSAWIKNKSLSECASLGNRAARVTLDVKGTQADPGALEQLGKLI